MIRLLGVLLIFGGGGGIAGLTLRRRQKELDAVGELLYALHRMEREIRAEGRGLRDIFSALAEESRGETGVFFCHMLRLWQEPVEMDLLRRWEESLTLLCLPAEGGSIWRELGRRLEGDSDSLEKGLALAAEELTALQTQLKQTLPEQKRVVTALSLSGAAILSVLLL